MSYAVGRKTSQECLSFKITETRQDKNVTDVSTFLIITFCTVKYLLTLCVLIVCTQTVMCKLTDCG